LNEADNGSTRGAASHSKTPANNSERTRSGRHQTCSLVHAREVLLLRSPATRIDQSRRNFPRLLVEGRLEIAFSADDAPVVLHDVSVSGFSIETPEPATPGQHRLFWLSAPGGDEWLVGAVAMHCGSTPTPQGVYRSGWLADEDPRTAEAFEAAIDHLVDTLTFAD
jgi:hypothetical protein